MSQDLIEEYKKIHRNKPAYGSGDPRIKECLQKFLAESGIKVKKVLDYGCGKSSLVDEIFPDCAYRHRYDPAISEFDDKKWEYNPNLYYDLILCNDVLEHIPEDELVEMFDEMSEISDQVIFTVHCAPAKTKLSDGRNAHVTIKSVDWWLKKFKSWWPETFLVKEFPPKFIAHCVK